MYYFWYFRKMELVLFIDIFLRKNPLNYNQCTLYEVIYTEM
jgi:hypothetical protein